MAKVDGSIIISAPVEKVWELFKDIEKLPEWMPLLMDVSDIHDEEAGRSYKWTYKLMGMKFKGKSTGIEGVPNQKMVTKSEGGINSKWTWNFKQEGEGTKMDVEVDYTIPVPVLGKVAESLLIKQNKREMTHTLENFKDILEA